MGDRNVNESIRKPRKAKGTPFYVQRNYYSLAVVGFGALCWYLYELWPQSARLKRSIEEGRFEPSAEMQERLDRVRLALQHPNLEPVIARYEARKTAKEDAPKEEPWYVKIWYSTPDI